MIGYKGFDENFCCCDFQYEVGKTYTCDGDVQVGKSGFHFCVNPLDVLNFYPPSGSRFALVEATGKIVECQDTADEDYIEQFCTNTLTIIKELSLEELVQEAAKQKRQPIPTFDPQCKITTSQDDYAVVNNTHLGAIVAASGFLSAVISQADDSAAVNVGDCSCANNTGERSVAVNLGDNSVATNSGEYSFAISLGYHSAAVNLGLRSVAIGSGSYSTATSSGNRSIAVNTGYNSAATVQGKKSIAIATGERSRAKGALGCWLVLTEWNRNFEEKVIGVPEPVDVQVFKVDGEIIKADTFYTLKGGKPVEAND